MSFLLDNMEDHKFLQQPKQTPTQESLPADFTKDKSEKIAVIGLGYVGLPLATRLSTAFRYVVGMDLDANRIRSLRNGVDRTNEVSGPALRESGLRFTENMAEVKGATFFVVTVPTPITKSKKPDLAPLEAACASIAPLLKLGDIVVFESTVYPGVTEDVCGPILEAGSGLKAGVDFNLGYSPERINPGDKLNTVENIVKVVSADTDQALDRIENVYGKIIDAGIYRSPSIKVAEGAKVLENTQRDVNIALMNELSLICSRIGIATKDVIDAAATKWNFVPFTPGLVGGHCIGVDPYYLASLAEELGLHPKVILAGRRINDEMVHHVTEATLRLLIRSGKPPKDARIGVLGITFKENVPDVRNSKAIELVHQLRAFDLDPIVHDPHCSLRSATQENVELSDLDQFQDLDLMLLACPHEFYLNDKALVDRTRKQGAIVDIRGVLKDRDLGTRDYWTL